MKKHYKLKRWFRGPEFLWKPGATWKNKFDDYEVDQDDKQETYKQGN